jgi:hypothetical protein
MCVNRCRNFRKYKCDKEASLKDFKNYKYLTKEIQPLWNVRAKATLVVTWATGTISKLLRQYLNNISGIREIKERLGTEYIPRKVLMLMHKTFNVLKPTGNLRTTWLTFKKSAL